MRYPHMKSRLLVVALAAACVVPVLGAAAATGPALPGQPAPDLRLPKADGTVVSIAANRGKVVLVDFWASWCGPCKASFPALDALYGDLRSRGLEVIAVNVDERREDAAAFLLDQPHAMTVVFDPNGDGPLAYGVKAMPTSFLIGRDGIVRFVHTGYTAKAIDAYRREIEQLLGERPVASSYSLLSRRLP